MVLAGALQLTLVLLAASHKTVVDGSAESVRRAEIRFDCDE